MANQVVQAPPEATGADAFLAFASIAALILVWSAVVRAVRRRGAPAWLAHVTGFVVSFFYFFVMAGGGFASGVPMAIGLVGLSIAIACMILAARVPMSPPKTIRQVVQESKQSVNDELSAARARIAKLEATLAAVPSAPQPLREGQNNPVIPVVDAVSSATPPIEKDANGDLACLVKDMMADGVFSQSEAEYLFQWLDSNQHRLDQYPFSAIYQRLTEALADGVLDEDEADDISELFQRLALNEPAVVVKFANPPAAAPQPPIPKVRQAPKPVAKPKPRAKRRSTSAGIDRILINYEDSMGFDSERELTVYSIDDFYVKGYCHLRKAPRTFRIDRIVGSIVRTETGEVMPFDLWSAVYA